MACFRARTSPIPSINSDLSSLHYVFVEHVVNVDSRLKFAQRTDTSGPVVAGGIGQKPAVRRELGDGHGLPVLVLLYLVTRFLSSEKYGSAFTSRNENNLGFPRNNSAAVDVQVYLLAVVFPPLCFEAHDRVRTVDSGDSFHEVAVVSATVH